MTDNTFLIIFILVLVLALKLSAAWLGFFIGYLLMPRNLRKQVAMAARAARQTTGQAYGKTSWGRQRDIRKQMKDAFQGRDAANKVNSKLTRGGGILGWRSARASLRRGQVAGFSPLSGGRAARSRVADY